VDLLPIALGFIAGATVAVGSVLVFRVNVSRIVMGYLGALTGGILAYLALDTGAEAEEIVTDFLLSKDYLSFITGAVLTSIGLVGTWVDLLPIALGFIAGATIPLTIAAGLGAHNVGEGFAIAAALLSGSVSSALAFTIGFAVHNATEGVAISSSALVYRRIPPLRDLLALSLLAGLPTTAGALVYYLGITNRLFLAVLNVVASASLVFVMVRVNITAASLLGGFGTRFWVWLFMGVALTYTLESILTFLGLTG